MSNKVQQEFTLGNILFSPTLYRTSLALGLVFLVGCVSIPAGTSLDPPIFSSQALPQKAWINTVKITDSSVSNPVVLEDSLRGNLKSYIQSAGYFRQFDSLPGKTAPDDLVLNFHFDAYQQERSIHPAYFPLAIATLTFYIWFGGPIAVDKSYLSGNLEIFDGVGHGLLSVSSTIKEKHNVSVWSPDYALPSGIKARTELIEALLSKAKAEINNKSH